jgi:hypothetical protein
LYLAMPRCGPLRDNGTDLYGKDFSSRLFRLRKRLEQEESVVLFLREDDIIRSLCTLSSQRWLHTSALVHFFDGEIAALVVKLASRAQASVASVSDRIEVISP